MRQKTEQTKNQGSRKRERGEKNQMIQQAKTRGWIIFDQVEHEEQISPRVSSPTRHFHQDSQPVV